MVSSSSSGQSGKIGIFVGHMSKGGMAMGIANLSWALSKQFNDIELLYFGTEQPDFDFYGKMVNLAIPGSMQMNHLQRLFRTIQRYFRLRKYVRRNRIETLISFGEIANVLNVLVSGKKKTILAVQVDLLRSQTNSIYHRIYHGLVRLLYRHADAVVAISEQIAADLQAVFHVKREKIHAIPNIYRFEDIKTMAVQPLEPIREAVFAKPVVINIANLNEQKSQKHLIRAFVLAKQNIPELQLVIVGRGHLLDNLQRQATQSGYAKDIHFLGFQDNPYKFIKRAHLFVLSSLFEGIPTVLLEAMALGVPVISTDCKTGPREVLGDSEFGVLVPDVLDAGASRTEEAIAHWMVKLIQNPSLAEDFVAKAFQRIRDFHANNVFPKWAELISQPDARVKRG